MNELLAPGQIVQSTSGKPCTVEKFLGGGGQGEVYKASWATGSFALKWYFLPSATDDQRTALGELIAMGTPSDKFLWPLDLAYASGVPGFGYLMKLRDPKYKNLNDLMANRISPAPTSMGLVTAGLELSKAFRSLHNKGLCYRDISFGNAFFDPQTGDIMVCDNDNVATNRTKKTGVLGTPDFMAPEIVRMEAVPSRETDFYSLAVLLFYILHIGHPLSGKKILSIRCWDALAREKMYGKEPVFIFDPNDDSNLAVDKTTDPTGEAGGTAMVYWKTYPQFLRDTFIRAFTVGLHKPESRPLDLDWIGILARLRDSIFTCACGAENFYDPDAVKASGGRSGACWNCENEPRLPFRLRIEKSVVMLNSYTKLYPHHLDPSRIFDFSSPVAEVARHPTDSSIWGLKNLCKDKWVATLPNSTVRDVEPGRSLPLATGTKVNFGKVDGEIRY